MMCCESPEAHVIDNGLELFGNAGDDANGFVKLARLAGNLEGQRFDGPVGSHGLDASFPLFATLLVWVDANRDGVSQPDELSPASQHFSKISLLYQTVGKKDPHGNLYRYQGWIEVPAGGRRPVYDVIFVTN